MKPADTTGTSLAFISPVERQFVVDGAMVVIGPMNTRMMVELVRRIEPIVVELSVAFAAPGMLARLEAGKPSADDLLELMSLLAHHGDPLVQAVALLARVDGEWLAERLPDRTASIAASVVAVNADFFRQAMPGFMAQVGRPTGPAHRIQPTPATAEA